MKRNNNTQKIIKSSVVLIICMILTKLSGLFKEIALSYRYGASGISDAIILAQNLPNIIFGGLIAALTIGYISIAQKLKNQNDSLVTDFTCKITSYTLLISAVISSLIFIFPNVVAVLMGSGLEKEYFDICCLLIRITSLSFICIAIGGVLQGYLQINGFFSPGGIINLLVNIVISIAIIVSSEAKIEYVGYGMFIAYFLYIPVMGITSKKVGLKYKFNVHKDAYVTEFIGMIIPLFISQAAVELNAMIDRTLASSLESGTISALNYGFKLSTFIYSIFATTIATVFYPLYTKLVAENNHEHLEEQLRASLKYLILMLIPSIIGIIVISNEITSVLFMRGQFDTYALQKTSTAMCIYAIGVFPIGLRVLLEKVYYASEDSKSPMAFSVFTLISNVVFSVILMRFFDYKGLALGTTLASFCALYLYLKGLKKKKIHIDFRDVAVYTLKILFSSLLMGTIVYFENGLIFSLFANFANTVYTQMLNILICTATGMVIYGVMLKVLHIQEVNRVAEIFFKKAFRKPNK